MSNSNNIPITWDNEQDNNLLGSLFQGGFNSNTINPSNYSENNKPYISPFVQKNKPKNGNLLKLQEAQSIFENEHRYIIHVKKLNNGSEVLDAYNNFKVEQNQIAFFCEATDKNKSNLFGTFLLVKFGQGYRALLNDLMLNKRQVSSEKKNGTEDVIKSFDDEILDNFHILTKDHHLDVDLKKVDFVMRNEMIVSSSAAKTFSSVFDWQNGNVTSVVDGINDWLTSLKFERKNYLPEKKIKKDFIDEVVESVKNTIEYIVPDSIENFVTKTFEGFLSEIKGLFKENLPSSWVASLKKVYHLIKAVLEGFKFWIDFLAESTEEVFLLGRALIMGFVNGLISTVQTIISIVGWLVKNNIDKVITGESYRNINKYLEFVEDIIDLVSEKIGDIYQAIENLVLDFSFEKIKDTFSVFKDKFKDTTRYDVAFFIGSFVFEVVLGVILTALTEGGFAIAKAAEILKDGAAVFKLFIKEMVSVATLGLIDIINFFKIIITKFAQACTQGWKGFKQFLVKLVESKTDDVVKEEGKVFDEVFDGASNIKRGNYLGQALEEADFKKIEQFLNKNKVDLQIGKGNGFVEVEEYFYPSGNPVTLKPNEAAMFITDGKKMKLILRENATIYETLHELMHFRDCQKIGKEAFISKEFVDKEKFVFDKMVSYKNYLTRKELEHAELYINDTYYKYGKTDNLGNPIRENLPFTSNNIPNKRQKVNIEKILKLK